MSITVMYQAFYKGVLVGKNSALNTSLSDKNGKEKEIFDETTKNAMSLYGEENYKWFMMKSKELNAHVTQ